MEMLLHQFENLVHAHVACEEYIMASLQHSRSKGLRNDDLLLKPLILTIKSFGLILEILILLSLG